MLCSSKNDCSPQVSQALNTEGTQVKRSAGLRTNPVGLSWPWVQVLWEQRRGFHWDGAIGAGTVFGGVVARGV